MRKIFRFLDLDNSVQTALRTVMKVNYKQRGEAAAEMTRSKSLLHFAKTTRPRL